MLAGYSSDLAVALGQSAVLAVTCGQLISNLPVSAPAAMFAKTIFSSAQVLTNSLTGTTASSLSRKDQLSTVERP